MSGWLRGLVRAGQCWSWEQRWCWWPAARGPLTDSLRQCWRERPPRAADWRQIPLLAVDLETSGLNPATAEVLSMGWVDICAGAVQLASSRHVLIQPRATVGNSAAIHQLRDCELAGGATAAEALAALLAAARGRVLVFHHAGLDMAFLNQMSRRLAGAPLLLPVLDTLRLEQDKLLRQYPLIRPGELTLSACRRRYNLPPLPGHNALVDAIATAELLLAMMAWRGEGGLPG
jgi:DNA polymerase-3 subunit epsilon